MRSTNIVWWESFGRWKLSLSFPFVHPASHKRLCLQSLDLDGRKVDWTCLYFALFQWWLDMFTFCTFLSISFFLSLNFFFVHPASHKRLCLQTLDLDERKVGWTCLYFALFQSWFDMFIFCTLLREKLMENFLYFKREVDWTCLHFALFWEGKVDGKCLHFERKDD